MSKRPDTKETVLLALELMRRIPRSRKVTARELHEQLAYTEVGRDLRTVQRQLEMLSEHFDIERDDRSKPYGYAWKACSRGLSLISLTQPESLLLTLAEQHLKALLPTNLMKTMDGFFEQARKNLAPYSDAKREREWLKKVRVVSTTQPLLPPRIKPGVFEQVSNAIKVLSQAQIHRLPGSSSISVSTGGDNRAACSVTCATLCPSNPPPVM